MRANIQVTKYIHNLYQYLGDKYCFLSGAFVIEDTNQNLFNFLYSNPKKPLKILSSHLKYNQHKQYPKDDHYYLYETVFEKPTQIDCNCEIDNTIESRQFRSMKWYKFVENNKHFLYLKIEDYPTVSGAHLMNAIQRYKLHKSNVSCREPRREDCEKGGTVCKYTQQQGPNYDKFIFNTSNERVINETYTRKGDEMFIPNDINEYILGNLDVSESLFSYNDNTITLLRNYRPKMQKISAQKIIDTEDASEPELSGAPAPDETQPLPPPVPEETQPLPEPAPVSEEAQPLPPPAPVPEETQPLPEPAPEPNTGGKRKSRTLKKHKRSTRSKKSKQNKKSTKSKKSKKTKKTKTVKH